MPRDYIFVDVEADGPAPGLYSMVSFGAVAVSNRKIVDTLYGRMEPLEGANWIPEALAVSGHSREEQLSFPPADEVMQEFNEWVREFNRPLFVADNNGFDWQFVNYYFHAFVGSNPFGFSSQNLNSLYKGATGDMYASFKHLRKTRHTHHPVDDAKGNAEAFIAIADKFDIKGI